MQKPGLVASDVDGTLLDPLERVSERTARMVRQVVASGTPFVLVTGRPPRWVTTIAEQAGTTGIAVCANGAVRYDVVADRVLHAETLDPVLLADAASAIDTAIPGSSLATERLVAGGSGLGGTIGDSRCFLAEPGYTHAWPDPDSHQASRAEVLGHAAVKLLVRHSALRSEEMAAAASAVLGDAVDITYSTSAGLIELSAPGISKATGLAAVAAELGVPAAEVLAFGDMPNDSAMLSWAGHGVAMANAHPDVLDLADEITASNSDDGVALVLERWF